MIKFGSGSYSVRESEGLNPQNLTFPVRTISCTVTFLDNTERRFEIERHAKGQILLNMVFEHLELIEKDYFGLQYISALETSQTGVKKWLDPTKSIRKQLLYPPYQLHFRLKFYVSDPSKLMEEYTRYHVFLQLKKDLLEGRLICPKSTVAMLASYAAQSEFGDYSEEEHGTSYLNDFNFIPEQNITLIKNVIDLHKLHKGQSPAEAEFNFLKHAKDLELYGIDLYPAKENSGAVIGVGVSSSGVVLVRCNRRESIYPWSAIMKLSFKKKLFSIYMRTVKNDNDEEDTVVVFNIQSPESCKALWKSCIEHHTFFRLIAPPVSPPKSFFSIGSRFRYSGRTEYQTMEEMRRRARVERTFLRHSSRDSQTMMNGNSLGPRDCASSCKTTSPVIASRIFCRSQICLRKWLGGRLRSASPSSSTMMTITTSRAEGTATSIGTLDNSLQFTGCTLPRSNLSPMSSAVTSNSSSKFQQLETSNVIAVAQEKNTDSCGDKNAKVSSKIDIGVYDVIVIYTSYLSSEEKTLLHAE
ncbi:Tyrosine-protein phosphatase [Dirofilaria immitis]